jgi:hypothetical protein
MSPIAQHPFTAPSSAIDELTSPVTAQSFWGEQSDALSPEGKRRHHDAVMLKLRNKVLKRKGGVQV